MKALNMPIKALSEKIEAMATTEALGFASRLTLVRPSGDGDLCLRIQGSVEKL